MMTREYWWWNELQMTLVLAIKTKDGIVCATDGRLRRRDPITTRFKRGVVDDGKKLFELGTGCVVMISGTSTRDVDQQIETFSEVYEQALGEQISDIDFWYRELSKYVEAKYRDVMGTQEFNLSLIIAGYDAAGTQKIRMRSTSDWKSLISVAEHGFWAAGYSDEAFSLYAQRGSYYERSAEEALELSKQIMKLTIEQHGGEVGGDLNYWLLTPVGLKVI